VQSLQTNKRWQEAEAEQAEAEQAEAEVLMEVMEIMEAMVVVVVVATTDTITIATRASEDQGTFFYFLGTLWLCLVLAPVIGGSTVGGGHGR